MDFKDMLFFDNHTHLLDPNLTSLTKKSYIMRFVHGYQDMEPWDKGVESDYTVGHASEWQVSNIENLGIVKLITHYLSERFGCEETPDAVAQARNAFIAGDPARLKEYTKSLYSEEGIIGSVLDSHDPWGDTKDKVFPCPVYRLYNFEDDYFELLPNASSFKSLMEEMEKRIRSAIKDGFKALKGHVAENYTMEVRVISDGEAEKKLAAAQKGEDRTAVEDVFFAMYRHVLLLAAELDVTVHIHAGTTGFNRKSAAYVPNLDPFLFVPFYMSDNALTKAKVVFLHQGFPYTRHAGMIAYAFPNIFVDTSWVLPWNSYAFRTNLEDLLGVCPHKKILFGTGQHGIPEIAWVAAKVAKACLGDVLESQCRMGFMSAKQAEKTARQLLFENGKELYKIK
ncbi:MAG: amidohydrolase family protein [Synergistes jonesii]|uniref:amidohydrolase family protein n=1 Tax=Synergistes jonesii TaxID=2754 RepID=UPI002A766047|nr:amidohydrolase family protein [Synergistes jonesii]MDY2984060.1 amidohydrolase family protein [Synergistes jonesii]